MAKLRPFCMPKWGIEMTEGTIAEWMVSDGDAIAKGDVICLIETDKITNEVEAERDGVLLKIVEPARDEALPVGALLAVIGDEKADEGAVSEFVEEFVPSGSAGRKPRQSDTPSDVKPDAAPATDTDDTAASKRAREMAEAEGVTLSEIEGTGRAGRVTRQDVKRHIGADVEPRLRGSHAVPAEDRTTFASPLARRLAQRHDVDLASLDGTGPRGRISKHDVMKAAKQSDGPARSVENAPTIEPFTRVQALIAERMTAAKREIPHFYLRRSARADALLAARKTANAVLGCEASLNDLLVLAVGKALARHPDVNVQVHDGELHRFAHADIAIAVDSPKGLVTPVVRAVDTLGLDALAEATTGAIERARAGRLSLDELEGGNFTVSNLGMFGIEQFDAIINPPQGAILAIGAASRVPVEAEGGGVAFETRMALTLSVDHRAIDGATGARFMTTLVDLIEQPETIFGR